MTFGGRRVRLLLIPLALLAGCQGHSGSGAPSVRTTPSIATTVAASDAPTGELRSLKVDRVTSSPKEPGPIWTAVQPEAGSKTLTIQWQEPRPTGCGRANGVQLSETATQITIRLEVETVEAGTACQGSVREAQTTILLNNVLGTRKILEPVVVPTS